MQVVDERQAFLAATFQALIGRKPVDLPLDIEQASHDHRHQSRRVRPCLFDPAKLFAPTEQLADMDAGRAGKDGGLA